MLQIPSNVANGVLYVNITGQYSYYVYMSYQEGSCGNYG